MTNSTDVYWDVDGQSIQTYAFNITDLGGDRLAPPGLRGDDIIVPGTPGRIFMPKVVDSRIITLGMWVIGAEEDGSRPSDGNRAAQFDENWRKLRSLLFRYGSEMVLTKRFYVAGVLKTASAKASYAGGLVPDMQGPHAARFTVDLRLSDPYFYGPEITENLSASETVTIGGDDITRNVKFEISGARTNVVIRNTTLSQQVEYHNTLATGDKAYLDVMKYTSVTDPLSGSNFNSIGSIRHTGAPAWFTMRPGANAITVVSSFGTGSVDMIYREAWF